MRSFEKPCRTCNRIITMVEVGTPRRLLPMERLGRYLVKKLAGPAVGHTVRDGHEVRGELLAVIDMGTIERMRAEGADVAWCWVRHNCPGEGDGGAAGVDTGRDRTPP